MQKIIAFLKNEAVLAVALAAACLSMLIIPPDAAYVSYVDFDVLMLLFSLMAVVSGLKRCGVMDRVCGALVTRASSARMLCALLSMACFFSAMLVTNDVALLTFVPLTCALLSALPRELILTVTIETVAANLGSMATPIGNPQNLYLFSASGMSMGAFFAAVLPLTGVSLVVLMLACCLIPAEPVSMKIDKRAGGMPKADLIFL